MEPEGSIIFHESNYLQSSFSAFQEMRIKMEFTDVVIKVRDRDFPAHLVVLAARFPHFQKVSLTEDKKIVLNEIDPDCMQTLINFAYEGKLKITTANVQQVFFAAVRLQLGQVQQICFSFLTRKFSSNSDLVISPFLKVIPSDEYIHQNFDQFSSTQEFLALPYFSTKEIFSTDNLKVTNEEKVFEALIKWIKVSLAERQHCLPYLLSEIRMNFLSPEYLIEKVSAEGLIKMSDQCKHMVEEAKSYHLLKKRLVSLSFSTKPRLYTETVTTVTTNQSVLNSDSSTTGTGNQSIMQDAGTVNQTNQNFVEDNATVTGASINQNAAQDVAPTNVTTNQSTVCDGASAVRTTIQSSLYSNVCNTTVNVRVPSSIGRNGDVSNGIKHGIYAFRSFTAVGTFVSYYNCRSKKWDNFPKNSPCDNVQHVVPVKDKLYVLFPKGIETFNLVTHEWGVLGPIEGSIKGAGIASYGSIIYLFGGHHLPSIIQCFDTQKSKWVENGDMKYPCRNMSVVSAPKKCIFITGGYTTACCNIFLKFHPITKTWRELAPMICPRMDHDSAVLNEKVYVCGGGNGNVNFLSTAEVYDKSANQWIFISHPGVSRHLLSLLSWDKRLYAFGGMTQKEKCFSAVEIYDPATNKWLPGAPVPSHDTRVIQGMSSHLLPSPLPHQELLPVVIRGVVSEAEE